MRRSARAEKVYRLSVLDAAIENAKAVIDQLQKQYESREIISKDNAKQTALRILAMSNTSIAEYFRGYSLRVAGENPWRYHYGRFASNTLRNLDPEVTEKVDALNIELYEVDKLRLRLRVAELMGGRVFDDSAPWKPLGTWQMALDLFETAVDLAKVQEHFRPNSDPFESQFGSSSGDGFRAMIDFIVERHESPYDSPEKPMDLALVEGTRYEREVGS